jgi:hypothetical protein
VIPPGLARSFLPPDCDVAIFGRALNYFPLPITIAPPRSGGSGLTGKSGPRPRMSAMQAQGKMDINTAATFMLVAFIKNNRLSSFFSEICRSKFSKFFRELEKS